MALRNLSRPQRRRGDGKTLNRRLAGVAVPLAASLLLAATPALAQPYAPIGGPSYDPVTGTGYVRGGQWWCSVNDSGVVAGTANKYIGGIAQGQRGLLWDVSGATTELERIENSTGTASAGALLISPAGTAAGYCHVYILGVNKGYRAVRWDAGGTIATELGNLGTDADGYTVAGSTWVSDDGTVVGYARKYVGGSYVGDCAVLWGADGQAVDLNTLIDPTSGWNLTIAYRISDNGQWIEGVGAYDLDGAGPLAAYDRLFVMQVAPVPEPATLMLLALGGLGAMLRAAGRRGRR